MFSLVFLNKQFFSDYPSDLYPQILSKEMRPYLCVKFPSDSNLYLVPLRSNLKSYYSFYLTPDGKRGLDFNKTIILKNNIYLDLENLPQIDQKEYGLLMSNQRRIKDRLYTFLHRFQRALTNPSAYHNEKLIRYSSLSYFTDIIEKGHYSKDYKIPEKFHQYDVKVVHIAPDDNLCRTVDRQGNFIDFELNNFMIRVKYNDLLHISLGYLDEKYEASTLKQHVPRQTERCTYERQR